MSKYRVTIKGRKVDLAEVIKGRCSRLAPPRPWSPLTFKRPPRQLAVSIGRFRQEKSSRRSRAYSATVANYFDTTNRNIEKKVTWRPE